MSQIKDIARVNEDGGDSIPDTGENISTSAKLVWHLAMSRVDRAKAIQYRRNSQPGFLWNGSQARLIKELWPALSGGYLLADGRVDEILTDLNRYLKNTNAMVYMRNKACWWVNENWTPLTVQQAPNDTTTDDTAPQDDQEEPTVTDVTVETLEHPCRAGGDCERSFTFSRHRSHHEYHKHGLAFRPNGDRVYFTPGSKPTDSEVDEMVLQTLWGATEALSFRAVWVAVRDIDPRVPKPDVQGSLNRLGKFGQVRFGEKTSSYYQFFELVPPAAGFSFTEAVNTITDTTPVQEGTAPGTSLSQHVTNLEAALADLRLLAQEENYLAALLAENQELTLANEALIEELAVVKNERDKATSVLALFRKTWISMEETNS